MMLIGRVYCPTCRTHYQYMAPEPPVECPKGHSAFPSAGYDDHPHEGDPPSRPSPDSALAPDVDDLVKRMIEDCAPFLKPGESPAQCIERNRADADQCLALSVRYQRALEAIVALDFAKDAHGRDNLYSGAPRFVQAWHLANDALREGSGPTPAERALRVTHEPPVAAPALARVQALEDACRVALDVFRNAGQLTGHSGDEESGQHDEDCFACHAEAALEQLAAALEGAATTPEK